MAKCRTSFLNPGVSGRLSGIVYVQGRNGTLMRGLPARRVGRVSDAERAGQDLTRSVADHWARLDPAAMARWRSYVQAQSALRAGGGRSATNGWNEYFAVGKKLLQIDAQRDLPAEPPTGRFVGDLVQFGVEAYADGDLVPDHLREERPPQGVRFVANRGNDEGVLTELTLQGLANGGRLPTARGYRSQGFVAFEGAGVAEVPVFPGWWACATRFVEAATGRATELVPCGTVFVNAGTRPM